MTSTKNKTLVDLKEEIENKTSGNKSKEINETLTSEQKDVEKIEKRIAALREKFKSNAMDKDFTLPCLSTGSRNVDKMLQGGIRPGLIEVFGPEGAGKSTFSFSIIAAATQKNKFCVLIDAENGVVSSSYLRSIGINTDMLLVIQNSDGEMVSKMIEEIMMEKHCALIVVDSVAALSSERERDEWESAIGDHAKMITKISKKVIQKVSEGSLCSVLMINQVRNTINTNMFASKYQNESFTTTGGKAIKYYSNLRMEISHKEFLVKPDKTKIGTISKVKVIKSRFAVPHQECLFPIEYGKGYNKHIELFLNAVDLGVIEQNGSWYRFKTKSEESFSSKINAIKALEDESLYEEVSKSVDDIINRNEKINC